MKKRLVLLILLVGFIFLPYSTQALSKLKKCTYVGQNNDIDIVIQNDYSATAIVRKLNGQTLSTTKIVANWNKFQSYIISSNNANCPKYVITTSDNQVYASNNKQSTIENAQALVSLTRENFYDASVKEELLQCKYSVNVDGQKTELTYHIYSDDVLGLAFSDGQMLATKNTKWYHGADFSEYFLKSSKIDDDTYTCPVLTLEQSTSITVFPRVMPKEACNGKCITLKANSVRPQAKSIHTKSLVNSCIGPAIGLYNSTKYFFPYFRLYSDGTKEWSIDGKSYVPLSYQMTVKIDEKTSTKILLNNSLIAAIYNNNSMVCPDEIYRCVTKTNSSLYAHELSTSESSCKQNELGSNDGQALGSISYRGAQGAKTNDNQDLDDLLDGYNGDVECEGYDSIFGDVNDERSVAWLLQKILNYIKIIAPLLVLILSSVDFAKSILQSDEDSMSKAQKKLITRLILVAALFFIPTIVSVVLNIFGMTSDPLCGLN